MHDISHSTDEHTYSRTFHEDPTHPASFRYLVTVVSLASIALSGCTIYVAYQNKQLKRLLAVPKTFEECVKLPGSRILEKYPPVCITSSGAQFTAAPGK